MSLGAVALVLLGALCYHHWFSNFCLFLLLLLSLASMSHAWLTCQRDEHREQPAWQMLVIPLYVISLYFSFYVAARTVAQRWYPVYVVRQSLGPFLHRGDCYLVRRLPTSRHTEAALSLRPGTLVVYGRDRRLAFGRVEGFTLAPPARSLPGAEVNLPPPVVSPAATGQPRVVLSPLGDPPLGRAGQPSTTVRDPGDIIGPVVGRIAPPARRMWLSER